MLLTGARQRKGIQHRHHPRSNSKGRRDNADLFLDAKALALLREWRGLYCTSHLALRYGPVQTFRECRYLAVGSSTSAARTMPISTMAVPCRRYSEEGRRYLSIIASVL